VSSCELLKNPGNYGDTLVSVPGLVLHGPEQPTSLGDNPLPHHFVDPKAISSAFMNKVG
jgi:hypothetical protein